MKNSTACLQSVRGCNKAKRDNCSLRRDDELGHNDVKAVAVKVENEAVPKMGDAGPAVDSGYVESETVDLGMLCLYC